MFENRIFKDAFFHGFRVGNLYQVKMVHLGSCQLTYLIYNTEGILMGPYPM